MEDKKEVEEKVTQLKEEHSLSNLEMDTYHQIFSWLDMDQGGTIDEDELVTFLEAAGVADIEEGQTLMRTIDMDVDGEANFAEFLEFLLTMKQDILSGSRKVELRVLKRREMLSPGDHDLSDGIKQLEYRDSLSMGFDDEEEDCEKEDSSENLQLESIKSRSSSSTVDIEDMGVI